MASLAQTNKYLATEAMRKKAVRVSVATSSAIEGIHAPFKQDKGVKDAGATSSKAKAKRTKG